MNESATFNIFFSRPE